MENDSFGNGNELHFVSTSMLQRDNFEWNRKIVYTLVELARVFSYNVLEFNGDNDSLELFLHYARGINYSGAC